MRAFVLIASISLLVLPVAAALAGGVDLEHVSKGSGPVKVYIDKVTNESGKPEVEPDVFRQSLEKNFENRRSSNFDVVKTAAESDIQISAAIKYFQYLARGPLKPIPIMGLSAVDAAATATSNYVEIGVEYAVISTRTGETLWQSGVRDYLKRVMTPAESLPLIYDKISRIFLWKCFGKSRGLEVSPASKR